MPQQPVFDREERVPTPKEGNSSLPPELQGKSAEEVAAYYQHREQEVQLREQQRREAAARTTPPTPDRTPPSSADFWTDPAKSTEAMITAKAVTHEQFNQLTSQVQQGLIGAARITAREAHSDWNEYDSDIRRIMEQFDPWARANSQLWETAYVHAKGLRHDADVSAARESTSRIAEPVTPVPPEPEKPIVLSAVQMELARGLELGEERFKQGIKRQAESTFPFTFDNVRRNSARKD